MWVKEYGFAKGICGWVAGAVAGLALSVGAATADTGRGEVYVVKNDRGGVVGTRAAEIRRLKRKGKRVEIRGSICLSSCTMFLGAGNVCVSPETRFRFHSPSYYGRPLSRENFDYWSGVIAAHYPVPLRRWFMREGRHRHNGYFTISGAEIIRLGVAQCPRRTALNG